MTMELAARLRAALAVTAEKLEEVVRRLVSEGNPVRIVVFGSRARGDATADSDLDIAVILDSDETTTRVGSWLLEDIELEVDLLVTSLPHFNTYRHYVSSVHHCIDREGLVLYDRTRDTAANRDVIAQIVAGRDRAQSSRYAA